jgi:hypothetical protein
VANTRASIAKAGPVENVCAGSVAVDDGAVPFLVPAALEPYPEEAVRSRLGMALPEMSTMIWGCPLPAGHGPEQAGAIGFPLLGELLQPTPLPIPSIGRALSHGLRARWGCRDWVRPGGSKVGPMSMGCYAPEWGRFRPAPARGAPGALLPGSASAC